MYKYIHIFIHDDLKFNPRIVKMVNNEKNGFISSEHLFVTSHKRVYDEIACYDNVKYEKIEDVSLINKYAKRCKWLIVHSMPKPHKSIFIKNKYCHKIVWRVWGHDIGYGYNDKNIKNLIKKVLEYLWRYKVKKFYAIGIANKVDEINLYKMFGCVRTYRLPYVYESKKEESKKRNIVSDYESDSALKIMVGHSGHEVDNHINVLESLNKYKNENIKIYLVLSYGNAEYIKKVKEYVLKSRNEKIVILEDFLERSLYSELLSKMDIAIFSGKTSYALGNIAILLSLRKKIFVNRQGIIREAFDMEKVPYKCIDEIENMSFEEFSSQLDYSSMGTSLLQPTYSENIGAWHYFLKDLDKCEA